MLHSLEEGRQERRVIKLAIVARAHVPLAPRRLLLSALPQLPRCPPPRSPSNSLRARQTSPLLRLPPPPPLQLPPLPPPQPSPPPPPPPPPLPPHPPLLPPARCRPLPWSPRAPSLARLPPSLSLSSPLRACAAAAARCTFPTGAGCSRIRSRGGIGGGACRAATPRLMMRSGVRRADSPTGGPCGCEALVCCSSPAG